MPTTNEKNTTGGRMTATTPRPAARRGNYGMDAPSTLVGFGIGILITLFGGILIVATGGGVSAVWLFLICLVLIGCAGLYVQASRSGKFRAWARVLDELGLTGQEKLLDLGCGRGAVLLMAAQRLDRGRATGVDLWRTRDQSGNGEAAARANAEAEGVADRVEFRTGDLTDLPFGRARFDMVVSSLAIHNIPGAEGRARALDEAMRVLRPGGRIAIADIAHVTAYRDRLVELGAENPTVRNLGWRMWWGGPWVATHLVTATKPA